MDYFQSGEYTFLWKNLQPFLQTWPADWWSTFSYFLAALSCNFTANPKSTNYKAFCLVTSFRSIFVIEIEVWVLSMTLLRMNFSIKNWQSHLIFLWKIEQRADQLQTESRICLVSVPPLQKNYFNLNQQVINRCDKMIYNWCYCQHYHILVAYVLTMISNT